MTSTLTRTNNGATETDHSSRPAAGRLPLIDLVAVGAMSAVIAIHTSELSGKIEETAYLGFGYMLLIAASIISIVLLTQRDIRGWILGGFTSAATMLGFVLTPTTGLPDAKGDIGNWGETIAVWSLLAEGLVVVLSVAAISRARSRSRA